MPLINFRQSGQRSKPPGSTNNLGPTAGGGRVGIIKRALKTLGRGFNAVSNNAMDKFTGAYQVDQTNKANKAEAELAWQRELEMWDKMNQYNSPASQMDRFEAAGLNPNLMYSQGNEGNAKTLPQYNAAPQDYTGFKPEKILSYLSAFADMKIKGAQTDNIKAQNRVINAEALDKEFKNSMNQTFGYQNAFNQARINFHKVDQEYGKKMLTKQQWQYLQKYQGQFAEQTLRKTELDITDKDLENFYKENRNMMLEFGIQPHDKAWIRFLYKAIGNQAETEGSTISNYKKLQPLIEDVNY